MAHNTSGARNAEVEDETRPSSGHHDQEQDTAQDTRSGEGRILLRLLPNEHVFSYHKGFWCLH
jgi:hypothetical protein